MKSQRYHEPFSEYQSIGEAFFSTSLAEPSRLVFEEVQREGARRSLEGLPYREVEFRVRKLAAFLKQLGVTIGTPVAILSNTRPEWMIADIAVVSLGGISVSVYHSIPSHEVGFILADSGAEIIFCENEEQVRKVLPLTETLFPVPEREDIPASNITITIKQIVSFEPVAEHPLVTELGTIIDDETVHPIAALPVAGITRATTAALVYTSGTTGPPKGVIQTHGNHLANIRQAILSEMFAMEGSLFLFLPLAHAFAKLIGYLGFLTPAILRFPSVASRTHSLVDLARVADDMRFASADVVPAVPRLFEKIQSKITSQAEERNLKGKLIRATLGAAQRRLSDRKTNKASSLWTQIVFMGTTPLRNKIKAQIFGAHFKHAISGGAKLPVTVNEFFEGLEINIYEGYGLTETVVATNVNLINRKKIGSVGPCMDGIEVKIADDGEILFKGENISPGYHQRPKATKEAFEASGWFHTGDIGHVDSEGFLFITDRKKDLIITAGGKKIPPIELENILKASSLISQAVIIGDGKPYICALVTLDPLGFKGLNIPEPLSQQEQTKELIREAVSRVNESRASYETIKDFRIIPDDFSIENGILTPTMKVKRKVVLERYQNLVAELYPLP